MNGERTQRTEDPRTTGLIDVTPIVWQAMEKYVCAKVELERKGGATKRELEEARSYAVEAMAAVFFENPTLCSYRRRMDAVKAERSKRL